VVLYMDNSCCGQRWWYCTGVIAVVSSAGVVDSAGGIVQE